MHVHPLWPLTMAARHDFALLELRSSGNVPDAVLADSSYPLYTDSILLGVQAGEEGVEAALLRVVSGARCSAGGPHSRPVGDGELCLVPNSGRAGLGNLNFKFLRALGGV